VEAVQPLLDYVYGVELEAVDPFRAALDEFEDTVDPALIERYLSGWAAGKTMFDATFGTPELIENLTPASFFDFLNQIDDHTNAATGLSRLVPGTPAPKDPSTASWHALEEDLPKLKECLHLLLFGEATLVERIDRMLAASRPRRYITEELAVPSMLLVFADE